MYFMKAETLERSNILNMFCDTFWGMGPKDSDADF